MAKELPYFKFEPSEWQNGDIQMASDKAKIVYLEICCTYWQKTGNLSYAFALQRHCKGNSQILNELCECNAIKIKKDKICISFLDNQFSEIKNKSVKARKSALKRWGKSERNANAMQTHQKRNAIREDKIREDKIRKDDGGVFFTVEDLFQKYLTDTKLVNAIISNKKNKLENRSILEKRLKEFCNMLHEIGVKQKSYNDFTSHFRSWNLKKPKEQEIDHNKKTGSLIGKIAF